MLVRPLTNLKILLGAKFNPRPLPPLELQPSRTYRRLVLTTVVCSTIHRNGSLLDADPQESLHLPSPLHATTICRSSVALGSDSNPPQSHQNVLELDEKYSQFCLTILTLVS